MERTPLGSSGLLVSRIGYGCMGLSAEPRADDQAAAVLRHAVDLGVSFFDTANRYGKGHNESLVGRVFAGRTDDIVIATKFGFVGRPDDPHGVDGRPEQVVASCDASLRRLGVDTIDLYYLHRVDPKVPVEETVGAMADLVRVGKVRALGLSEAAPATIRRAHAVHPIAALQTELSLWSRQAQGATLETCRELGITFVAYSPLGIGFLTGAVRDAAEAPPGSRLGRSERVSPENIRHNLALVDRLRDVAADLRCTPSQVALAWLLAQGPDVVPIPGTRHLNHVEENVSAVHVDLGPEHTRTLDAVFSPDAPAGRRKSSAGLALVDG